MLKLQGAGVDALIWIRDVAVCSVVARPGDHCLLVKWFCRSSCGLFIVT